jgi:hypothetical protein
MSAALVISAGAGSTLETTGADLATDGARFTVESMAIGERARTQASAAQCENPAGATAVNGPEKAAINQVTVRHGAHATGLDRKRKVSLRVAHAERLD